MQKKKKIIGTMLTSLQVVVVILWILASINGDGVNPMVFNILPIPNIGDIVSFAIMTFLIISIQKMKVKLGVGENFQ